MRGLTCILQLGIASCYKLFVRSTGVLIGIASLMVAALGCHDEPGKVRGNMSTGARSAKPPEATTRFVIDPGDPFVTSKVLGAVRARLAPLGVSSSSASIVGATVVVDVAGPMRDATRDAMRGGRLDIHAGGERIVRGESLDRASANGPSLELAFAGSAKGAVVRAAAAEVAMTAKIDGEDHPVGMGAPGVVAIQLDTARAAALAKNLNERALGHATKLEQKEKP